MPRKSRPLTAASRHIGTIRITASGSVQLSYCAASSRKTKTTEAAKMSRPEFAGKLLLQRELGPFEAEARGSVSAAIFSIAAIACPVETPGSVDPCTSAAG